MTKRVRSDDLDMLVSILEAERNALLAGQLDRLDEIAASKERLILNLGSLEGVEMTRLMKIKSKIQHNHDLIEDSFSGVHFAIQHIEEIQNHQNSLNTYNRFGDLTVVKTRDQCEVERRA